MKSIWIEPHEIDDVWAINNRKENAGHIDSLAESMRNNGYLPQYPIIAFETQNIGIITDKPYVIACGHHRRKAAIQAEIDLVFAEVHDGTEEEWIEMMSTDNFQFDVASNPGIGLAFTEQERRAACYQLLLLPKYLRKTNIALSNLWKVSEGTIRRWRNEIESLINETSPKLTEWRVSEGRIDRLKTVIANPYRENADGETVAVRQKAQEATEEERAKLWNDLRATCLFKQRSDGKTFIERNDFNFEIFRQYICEVFEINDNGIPHQLSRNNLKKIQKWILTEDPEVIQRCQAMQQEQEALGEARQSCYATYNEMVKAFNQHLSPTPNDTESSVHKKCAKRFEKAAQTEYDFKFNNQYAANTLQQMTAVTEKFDQIADDIETHADWVRKFKTEVTAELKRDREFFEKQWLETRDEMFTALRAYPRDISTHSFAIRFDARFKTNLRELTEPDPSDSEDTLKKQIFSFQWAKGEIEKDSEWMQEIPHNRPMFEAFMTSRIVGLTISLAGGTVDGKVIEMDESMVNAWLPDELREQLVDIAKEVR